MAEEIVLTSNGSQTFTIVLDGINYAFDVSFNTRMGVWRASVSTEGTKLVSGISLVGGVNLLKQFTFILNNLFILNVNDPTLDATGENLGTDVKLFKLSDVEALAGG